ncbi:MAG: carbohydrate ABC transporter substrate-binding protein [Candidatus Pacebacteria bacterium]|nr:carbohydrate ABC transporter substrate-binding protein [Candidatus Paceibacterota bacterium]
MKLRPFELALIIAFGGLAIVALVILSNYKGSPDENEITTPIGSVEIWGSLPSKGIDSIIYSLNEGSKQFTGVTYRYVRPEEFSDKLTTALADGQGPDAVLISHEELVSVRQRIQPFSFPLRDFKDLYVDGASIFALQDGIYGYPIAVDPLMMYWNRNILTTEGYLDAPKTWEGLVNDVFPKLIRRDFDRTVHRSVVAMGEYGNVRNAFGIVSMLLVQQGSKGVSESADGKYSVLLNQADTDSSPLQATADFYTRFSRPSNALYSWNRAFAEDRQQFLSEDLVFYFGYGSEAGQLERLNPNLNFDIAEVPQGEAASLRRTYGKFYALSLLKASDNPAGTLVIMGILSGLANSGQIATDSGMVPAYRSLVGQGSNDVYGRITYQSAPISFGWLNPDRQAADQHFESMMRDINENRVDAKGAAADLLSRIGAEYQ